MATAKKMNGSAAADEHEAFVGGLPRSIRATVTELLGRGSKDRTALEGKLSAYEARLATELRTREFVDEELAHRVGQGLARLVADIAALEAAEQTLVTMAVEYFVLDGDVEQDFGSIVGFDDDAIVFNAVVKALGRTDLLVALK